MKVIESKIAPNPKECKYWVDLSSDPNGGVLKCYTGGRWINVNATGSSTNSSNFVKFSITSDSNTTSGLGITVDKNFDLQNLSKYYYTAEFSGDIADEVFSSGAAPVISQSVAIQSIEDEDGVRTMYMFVAIGSRTCALAVDVTDLNNLIVVRYEVRTIQFQNN